MKALAAKIEGKRSYHALFKDQAKTQVLEPTEGIAFSSLVVPHKENLLVNVMDFSGQEIYVLHPTSFHPHS